jgi:hypothetical protein
MEDLTSNSSGIIPTPAEDYQNHLVQPEDSPEPEKNENRFRKWYQAAILSGQLAVVAAEVTPLNEAARVSVYGVAEVMSSGSPLVGAAALGLSTLAVEGVGGLAAAGLLDTSASKKIIETVNAKGKKIGIPMDKQLSSPAKIFWTFMGGTPVGMMLEQREDVTRTKEQNRRYSMVTSAWQAGVMAVIGAGGAEVINASLENPVKAALVGGAVAIAGSAAGKLKKSGKIVSRHKKTKKTNKE